MDPADLRDSWLYPVDASVSAFECGSKGGIRTLLQEDNTSKSSIFKVPEINRGDTAFIVPGYRNRYAEMNISISLLERSAYISL